MAFRLPDGAARALALGALLWLLLGQGGAALAGQPIIRLNPSSGPTRGGTPVIIQIEEGRIFGSVQVRFGEQPAVKVRRLGLSTVEAVSPPAEPGPVAVEVENRLLGATKATAVFTYLAPDPRIVRVSPVTLTAGQGDARVEVETSEVPPESVVVVNDARLATTFTPPGRFQATVPGALLAGPGSLTLRMALPGQAEGATESATLTVVNPHPSITGVEVPPFPPAGPTGSLIVRGSGFRPDSRIRLADEATATRYRSAEELEGALPLDLLRRVDRLPVMVVTPEPGGGVSNPWTLAVVPPPLPPDPPPPPPLPGRFVVFTSNRREGRNHLFLLDRQTGRLDRLEEANSVGGNDAYPAISADGRLIVFQSDRRGQSDIFLFDREARLLDPLPEANHPAAFDGFPSISPDGRVIIFESDRVNRIPKLFLFDRTSRTLKELVEANEEAAENGLAAISN